jgi:hypothetical protein
LPSGTPATGTPPPSSEPRRTSSVHRRPAASAPSFLDSGHTCDRRELLNLFPHFTLAAGEPPAGI